MSSICVAGRERRQRNILKDLVLLNKDDCLHNEQRRVLADRAEYLCLSRIYPLYLLHCGFFDDPLPIYFSCFQCWRTFTNSSFDSAVPIWTSCHVSSPQSYGRKGPGKFTGIAETIRLRVFLRTSTTCLRYHRTLCNGRNTRYGLMHMRSQDFPSGHLQQSLMNLAQEERKAHL